MAINLADKKESYLFIDDVLEFINEDESTFDALLTLAKDAGCLMAILL